MSNIASKESCSFCKQLRPKKDGWRSCCNAFPDGIPLDYVLEKVNVSTLKECANGIKFTPSKN